MTLKRTTARDADCVLWSIQLAKAGFEADLIDVLGAQTHECSAKIFHHAPLGAGDRARIFDEILSVGGGPRFDAGCEGRRCRQALAEFVVEVTRKRAALLLLDLKQLGRQRCSRRIGALKFLGQVVDGRAIRLNSAVRNRGNRRRGRLAAIFAIPR